VARPPEQSGSARRRRDAHLHAGVGYSQTNGVGYALNGASTYPSMNFRALKGRPVKVKWANNAPDQHLFCPFPLDPTQPCAIDRTLMGTLGDATSAFGGPQQADNAMVVHLHGGEIPPDSDGLAELWFGSSATNSQSGTGSATYYAANHTPVSVPVVGSTAGALQNIDPILDTSVKPANSPPLPPLWNGVEAGNLIRPVGSAMIYNYPMVQAAARSGTTTTRSERPHQRGGPARRASSSSRTRSSRTRSASRPRVTARPAES